MHTQTTFKHNQHAPYIAIGRFYTNCTLVKLTKISSLLLFLILEQILYKGRTSYAIQVSHVYFPNIFQNLVKGIDPFDYSSVFNFPTLLPTFHSNEYRVPLLLRGEP